MPRVLGVDIPAGKRIEIALRYIYGIGSVNSKEILAKANFLGCLMCEAALEEPAEWQADPQRFAELRRIFNHPDFGPAMPGKPQAKEGTT